MGLVITLNRILIVEDDELQRKLLNKTALRINSGLELYSTGSFNEAIDIMKSNLIEAFFLDIQLDDGNGIELAKKIRSMNQYKFAPIIFLTAVATKEMEAFHDIHSYDYLIKPYSRERLEKVMKPILLDYPADGNQVEEEILRLDFKGIFLNVKMSDVEYIESRNRRIWIMTDKEEIKYKVMPIRWFLDLLNDDFIRVHQSFIVNVKAVGAVDLKDQLMTISGRRRKIPVGTSYKKTIVEVLNELI